MFKDSMQGVSNLSFALFASLKDMVKRNTFETLVSDEVQFVRDGDIYIPYSEKYSPLDDSFSTFMAGSHQGITPSKDHQEYFYDFKSAYISKEITTVSYTKEISISSMLEQLCKEKKIYGAVIQYQNKGDETWHSFNPMHPMVAFLIMADMMTLPEEGKLHIFEYQEDKLSITSDFNASARETVDGFKKDYEKFFEISDRIIKEPMMTKNHATIESSVIRDIINDPFVENIQATVEVHTDKKSAGTSEIKSLIVPNHLIMDGTASPYYGISTITNPSYSSIKGYALGPMATGNISLYNSGDNGYRTYPGFYGTAGEKNVCTGSESSTSPNGWFTLSKVNLESMYYSDIIDMNSVFHFIQASKEISEEIWGAYNKKINTPIEKIAEEVVDE